MEIPVNTIAIIVMTVVMSAIDTKLAYLPILSAIVGNLINEPMFESAFAGLVIGSILQLGVRLIRLSRGWENK